MSTESQQNGQHPIKRIFNYGCWLLAKKRYTVTEFRRKLEKKFPGQPEGTAEIVDLFLTKKYLDDTEYAKLFIREQLNRKPQGLRLVKQKLRQKGINETTLSSAFQEQIIDEDELIVAAVRKKLKTLKEGDPLKQKQKMFRFLASRGFPMEKILKALKNDE